MPLIRSYANLIHFHQVLFALICIIIRKCLEWRVLRRMFDIKQTRNAIKVKFYTKLVVERKFSSKTALSSLQQLECPTVICK